MNRFADYFSNYVNDDTITYIGNGDITSFTVSRQDRELAVGLNLESFIDYGIIENSQNQIARAMELKKVHINPRFPKSEFSLDIIERILEYVRHESPAANGFFDGCEAELEDRTLTLCLKKGGKDVLESQKVDRAIANKIYELFDLDFVVIFVGLCRDVVCIVFGNQTEQSGVGAGRRKRKKKTSTTSFGTNFLFLKIHLKKYTARQFTKSRRILPMFQPRTAI